nr:putative exosome complex exonuclease RRP40 [Cryptomonas sp.]
MNRIFHVKYLLGSKFLGFVLGFDEHHVCVYIGSYKVVIIIGSLNRKYFYTIGTTLFIKLETFQVCSIREKLKKLVKSHQNYSRGYFGYMFCGKIYRLTRGIVFNLSRQSSLIKSLKILGRKYELEFALGINGYIWVSCNRSLDILIFKEYIFD